MLMMSSTSMAASFTTTSAVIQPPLAEEESHNPTTTKTYNEENNKTIGPITDIARKTSACTETEDAQNQPSLAAISPQLIESTTSTSSIPFHSNLNAKTNSKIPYPLATLLASKTQQIRRSASLRLRGTKSNLLFNTFTQQRNNNNHSMRIEQVNTTPTTTTHKRASSNTMKNEMTDNQEVTHNNATTGRFSPRRKVVLNSTQQLNVHGSSGLTRSLSLKGNQNNKTDINTEESSCTVTKALNELTLNDNANLTKEPTPQALEIGGINDVGVPAINTNDVNQSTAVAGNGDSTYVDAQREQKKDTVKMSLNLNGPTSTAATAAAATAATATTTNVRPSTLITTTTPSKSATGNSATSSKAVTNKAVTSVRTPKTPTTTPFPSIPNTNSSNHHQQQQQQQQQQHHNHHHHHQHCSKQQYQQALPSVSETKLTPKTPPVTPDSPSTYLEDDLDSMYSFATTTSGRSTMSCEHPYVARNGTTFSGRKMKYVVHCSNYAGQVGPDYLTPTQRAQRQVKRLKELLCVARQDLEQKDSEILRLTREVVELRLFKASLSSPEDRSASSDAVTVREAELKTSQDVSPIVDMVDDGVKSSPRHILHHHHHHNHSQHNHVMQHSIEMQSSFADSGHFEDMTSSSVHSKDSSSYAAHTHDMACGSDEVASGETAADDLVCQANIYEVQRQELIRMYEQRIEELIRTQDTATSEIKRSHNDKVEALLQKLAECNTRYADIVPDYEHAKERIRELEKQLEDLQRKLAEHEEKQNKMYLHMYQKGQEAERIARADQALELAHRAPTNKVSINELLHQLQSTQDELENIRAAECRNETGSNHALLTAKEAISLWVLGARKTIYRRLLDAQKNRAHVDPEVTLQFLKSAVYYFLTDKENSQGHLQAIESILEFTEAEKQNINRARMPK